MTLGPFTLKSTQSSQSRVLKKPRMQSPRGNRRNGGRTWNSYNVWSLGFHRRSCDGNEHRISLSHGGCDADGVLAPEDRPLPGRLGRRIHNPVDSSVIG